jgi:hypothetical protein
MIAWLLANGFAQSAGHDEGLIFFNPQLYVAVYNGDGYWHVFARTEDATYDYKTAAAIGNGLAALQVALSGLSQSPNPPAPRSPIHR